jgi:hypothetical protein
MYDSTDGKKTGILKNVDCTCSDSIYAHKDSVTVSNNDSLVYAKVLESPELKEPIVMNTPRYSPPINPDYLKLGEIAKQTVIQTMIEGEKKHGADEWKDKSILYHKTHALEHAELAYPGYNNDEDHIAHCMTRCAIIRFLEKSK